MTARATLQLLGTFELSADDRSIGSFRSDKVRALLAWLAVEHNRAHQRSVPANLLWGNYAESAALKNLRMSLSNLKKLLGDAGLADAITISRSQVQLHPEPLLRCDVVEMQTQLRLARSAESVQATAHLEQAVALYRGEFLAGLSVGDADEYEQWRTVIREQTHTAIERALEQLIHDAERQRESGDGRLRQYAERLIALTPWHEQAHFALMRSFASAGLRSEALAQFEVCQSVLWEQLGVEPSDELIAYYEAVATNKMRARVAQPEEPTQPVPTVRHNLPHALPPFFGRNAERTQLSTLLRDPSYPLVTLVGEGGIGKTYLGLHTAYDLLDTFPDGVWFVSLEQLSALEGRSLAPTLLQAIGRALGIELATVESDAALDTLCTWLGQRQLLLLLDNLEHLLTSSDLATLVHTLLNRLPKLTILATSRVPLRLRSERVLRLGGLPIPDSAESATGRSSIELFAERAQRASGYALTDADLPHIVAICAAVEGSPLAIELAAGWTAHLSIGDIAATLRANLDALYTEAVDVPDRHRSLEAVFDYSWSLLTMDEQHILMKLSRFANRFSAEAALAVAGATQRQLAALVDKSLLRVETATEQHSKRYVIPAVLHAPCANRLFADPTQRAQAEGALANHYSQRLIDEADTIRFHQAPERVAALVDTLGNLQLMWSLLISAENWTQLEACATPLFHLYDTRSRYREGLDAFRKLTEVVEDQSGCKSLHAIGLARAGWFSFLLGRPKTAERLLRDSMQLVAVDDDAAFRHNYLGAVLMHGGDYAAASKQVQIGLQHATALQDKLGEIISYNLLGRIAFFEQALTHATQHVTRSLMLARRANHPWSVSFSLEYLAQIALERADYPEATRLLDECLAIRQQLSDRRGQGICQQLQGDLAVAQGDHVNALALYDGAYEAFDAIGNVRGMLEIDVRRADLLLARADAVAARPLLLRVLSTGATLVPETTLITAIRGMLAVYSAENNAPMVAALASWLVENRLESQIATRSEGADNRFSGLSSAEVAGLLW